VRREIFQDGSEIFVRSRGTEGLHAIDSFDPSFTRQLDGRRFCRFVTGAANAERLRFPRTFRQSVLCGRNRNTSDYQSEYRDICLHGFN
jgi:hypothetical protein